MNTNEFVFTSTNSNSVALIFPKAFLSESLNESTLPTGNLVLGGDLSSYEFLRKGFVDL